MRDVIAFNGVVVAGDPIAASEGARVLRNGGNAMDAIVATALTACVVQPHNVGLGGYAGTIAYYSAKQGKALTVDFDSIAPALASPDMFPSESCTCNWDITDDGGAFPGVNESGCLCITAPTIVAGLATALQQLGTQPFSDVALPAQRLAEDGFDIGPELAMALSLFAKRADPESLRAILPAGGPPKAGERLVQKDMAALIAKLRSEGPASFYTGEIAARIVERIRRGGGIVSEEDFRAVRARVEEPLRVSCGEYDVFTPGPPAGGITALQVLNVLNRADIAESDFATSDYYRLIIEAARHAWADRFEHLGDPDFVDVPTDELLSDRRAREILEGIGAGIPAEHVSSASSSPHTVHLVAIDEERNMASLTATHGSWFGSLVAVDGLGLLLGHGMSRFEPTPGLPNSIAPGKRMQHNMSPLVITREGRPYCAIGLPGGRKIINSAALLAHAITRFGLTCGQAIDIPRYHVDASGQAWVDSTELATRMRAAGVPVGLSKKRLGGPVAGALVARETGLLLAASEAGNDCVAIA